MPTPFPPELLTTFRAMAEIVYSGKSYDTVYDALCRSSVEFVDGCDHASLMLRRNGRTQTVAASDDIARAIDAIENALGEGPCLDAIDESEPDQHMCSDLTTGSRWPMLDEAILERTSVKGMAGFRIRQDGQKVGALNVFSDTEGALTDHSLEQAIMLTAFASVAMAALDRGEEAVTLRRGLESNREIGKAIGLLMAMHDIDDDQAFQMLSKVSQEMNIKLAQVASQVVAHHRARGA
jgi:GAF domain-containing protein